MCQNERKIIKFLDDVTEDDSQGKDDQYNKEYSLKMNVIEKKESSKKKPEENFWQDFLCMLRQHKLIGIGNLQETLEPLIKIIDLKIIIAIFMKTNKSFFLKFIVNLEGVKDNNKVRCLDGLSRS